MRILWPTTLNPCFAERLQELKEKEKEADFFTKMPSKHYMEVASLLLNRYVLIEYDKELVNYASNTNWLLQKELSCRVYFVVLSDFQVKKR